MINVIRSVFIVLFLAPLLFFVSNVQASHIPAPAGYANDFAGVLTQDQKDTLENTLREYEQKTGNEIAVALVKNLEGKDITDFTVRTFEEWKIGKKGKDNGVLFLAAIEDRKMRIEIGYGAEPYLTDSEAGEIIRNTISPRFKSEDYFNGINAGIEKIQIELSGADNKSTAPQSDNYIQGENSGHKFIPPSNAVDMIITFIAFGFVIGMFTFTSWELFKLIFSSSKKLFEAIKKNNRIGRSFISLIFTIVFFIGDLAALIWFGIVYSDVRLYLKLDINLLLVPLIVLLVYISSLLARSREFFGGAFVGLVLGGMIAALPAVYNTDGILIFPLVFASIGFILDIILSRVYKHVTSQGKNAGWLHTFGGFWAGKGSGGGFGGFGGGRSGGGGAGGGW